MKTKLLCLLLAGGLLVALGWLVRVPNQTHADEIPEKYRDTVHKGLEYLVKNQHKDGHWEGDSGKHPVAMTGLVGIALLMEKDNPVPRASTLLPPAKYSANIRKAADWLMDKSQAERDGLIYSGHASETSRYMQGHGFATLFLAGAFKDERDEARRKKLFEVLTRAVKYIVKAQSSQGGWYDTSKVEGHDFDSIAATVIQIQALQAAENAGIPVPSDTLRDAQEYLKTALRKYEDKAKAEQNRNRLADTAAALACTYRQNYGFGAERAKIDELREKRLKFSQSEIPMGRNIKFGRDELVHYYHAQAQFNLANEFWTGYRTPVFDHLWSSQNNDGSWPSADGIGAGPVYATALWCTVLQLDKRSHPSRPRDNDVPITVTRYFEHQLGPRFEIEPQRHRGTESSTLRM